jgi:hypothetical protein
MREPRRGRHAMATFWRLAGLWSGTAAGSCDVEEEGTSFMVGDFIVARPNPMRFHRSAIVAGRLALLTFSAWKRRDNNPEKRSGSPGSRGSLA